MSLEPFSGASRRDEAREKAKAIREQHRRQQRKSRLILAAIIAVVAIVVVGGGGWFLLNGQRPSVPGPMNMRSDGIVIGQEFEAVRTPPIPADGEPIPTVVDEESDAIRIVLYTDYFCPICGTFEKTNGEQLVSWLDSGFVTVEVHPVPLLDRVSQGTRYATRAANAAACVANADPDHFYDFHRRLFAQQPDEGSAGLSDDELIAIAKDAKVEAITSVSACITEQRFRPWVNAAKERALTGPVPDSELASVSGTPTVLVNGQQYTGAADDAKAFRQFVVKAAGTTFNENSTPTPTPTPPAPSATSAG